MTMNNVGDGSTPTMNDPVCRVSTRFAPTHVLKRGESLSIGRVAEMILSNDPYLHRQALRVEIVGDHVEVANVGSTLSARLVHERTRTVTQLEPGGRCALFEGRTTVLIRTITREHEVRIDVRLPTREVPAPAPVAKGSPTKRPRSLTSDQMLLLTALAEPVLLDPTRTLADLPSNKAVALRLGIGAGFNGRLDRLCAAVARLGVEGLDPVVSDDPYARTAEDGQPRKQRRRRERLVEWALTNNVVTIDSLDNLDAATREPAPRIAPDQEYRRGRGLVATPKPATRSRDNM